ncbi:MAG: hypothetical protein KDK78_11060, partial [Chlamydiia bacterium]|nr:hypothetical protein [Chlamydiia bacterium]
MATIQRLRLVYLLTLIVTAPIGMGILVTPETMRDLYALQEGEHFFFGVVGAVWSSFAIIAALGLRSPLRFAP